MGSRPTKHLNGKTFEKCRESTHESKDKILKKLEKETHRKISDEIQASIAEEMKKYKILLLGCKGSGKSTIMNQIYDIYGGSANLSADTDHNNTIKEIWFTNSVQSDNYEFKETYHFFAVPTQLQCASAWRKYKHQFDSMCIIIFVVTLEYFDRFGVINRDKINKLVYGYINEFFEEYNNGRNFIYIPDDLMLLIAEYCQINDVSYSMGKQLEMFEKICNDPLFEHCDLMIWLNKSDILEKKFGFGSLLMPVSNLKTLPFYKDLKKDEDEYLSKDEVIYHIKKMFKDVRKDNGREIDFYLTSAIDRECVRKKLLPKVRGIIIKREISIQGFL